MGPCDRCSLPTLLPEQSSVSCCAYIGPWEQWWPRRSEGEIACQGSWCTLCVSHSHTCRQPLSMSPPHYTHSCELACFSLLVLQGGTPWNSVLQTWSFLEVSSTNQKRGSLTSVVAVAGAGLAEKRASLVLPTPLLWTPGESGSTALYLKVSWSAGLRLDKQIQSPETSVLDTQIKDL